MVVAGWVLAWSGLACAEPVDPRNPAEWRAMQAEGRRLNRWLPDRIRQLEAERDQLLATISTLPQFDPALISDHLGYHSGHVDQAGEPGRHQLMVHFRYRPFLGAIALVPSINPRDRHGGAYAFPRRFRIEVLTATGTWSDSEDRWVKETLRWVEVANWWEEDFPDPGRYPVFFPANHGRVAKVRITVPYGTQGARQNFFSLGELFLFQSVDGQVADNMSVWGRSSIDAFKVSDSFSLPPFWDVRYLYDGFTGLGVPLSEERGEVNDFVVRFDDEEVEPVQILFDLGKIQRVGRVEFWPTEAPRGMADPLFAFPGKVSVELSNDPDFNSAKTIMVSDARAQMYHDNLLRIMCDGHEVRYIRLTLEELREENGKQVLGLGEVSVSEHGKVFSVGCDVSATGIPAAVEKQLVRLVDGKCRGRRILSETEWIMGLARRRPLDRRLAVVEQDLEVVRGAWTALKLRASIWGGGLICLGLLGAMGLQRLQRRKVLKGLKMRITRDLHDEVGSSLGGISLIAERMEEDLQDAGIGEDLSELSLMAREAAASLRDVVWVTDQDVIRLSALIEKLVERAERILSGVDVIVELPADLPNVILPLTTKRHLIMYFKEVVHNCAQHAGATRVQIRISAGEQLCIVFSDNGCGFEPAAQSAGWGLDSLKKRAEELGGKATIDSRPGEGTVVELQVPLPALLAKSDHLYRTSN
jgi:signal transduction histidine kinase